MQIRADEVSRILKEQIQAAEEMSFQVGQATSQYQISRTDADTKKNVYDLISKTMNEVNLSAQLLSNNVSILDLATPPEQPIKPRRRMNLFMGVLVGLFLGVGSVFFLDYLDNTLRTSEQVEQRLGLSVLAVVPRIKESGLEAHAVRDSVQTLRTSLIFSSSAGTRGPAPPTPP